MQEEIFLDLQEILERFAMIADIALDDASAWIPICREAMDEIKQRVKDDVNVPGSQRRLNAAAAALAFYRFILYKASGTSITTPASADSGVLNDRRVGVRAAYDVWRSARGAVADLMTDDDFTFRGVGGN